MDPTDKDCIFLVVPCFNERKRLPLERFFKGAAEYNLRILFVDDGSTDGTGDYVETQIANNPRFELLRSFPNRGKGAAVRQGMLRLVHQGLSAEWIGFWDADLSTPLSETRHMLRFLDMEGGKHPSVWASRVMRGGSRISRSFKRHLFGRIFATLVGSLLNVQIYDTQCGAKLFRGNIIPELFCEEFISRWIFDVELFCRLGADLILECPIQEWIDAPGSKVGVFRDFPHVSRDLYRIWRKYGTKL